MTARSLYWTTTRARVSSAGLRVQADKLPGTESLGERGVADGRPGRLAFPAGGVALRTATGRSDCQVTVYYWVVGVERGDNVLIPRIWRM